MERVGLLWFLKGIGGLVLLSACSAPHAGLERVRDYFVKTHGDPAVSDNAPVVVHEAAQSLRRAEQTWERTGDEEEVSHLVYLTERRIDIARQTAQLTLAEAEARRLAEQRDTVILGAREREAELARRKAAERAEALELAKQQAAVQAREAEQARQRAQASAARNKELEKQLSEFEARQTERGLELTLSGVMFEFDRAELKPGALRGLSPLITYLKENPERRIVLEGHTDSVGSESYNIELSQQRAQAVRQAFMQNGVGEERIVARGLGEAYPLASNDTEAGRLQNRRVEIIISNEARRG